MTRLLTIPPIVLRQLFSKEFTLNKITVTTGTNVWQEGSESTTTYTIQGEFQIMSMSDQIFLSPGIYEAGDARAWVYPSYKILGATIVVEVGDRIVYSEVTYDVDKINDWKKNTNAIYREVWLKRRN